MAAIQSARHAAEKYCGRCRLIIGVAQNYPLVVALGRLVGCGSGNDYVLNFELRQDVATGSPAHKPRARKAS